MDTELITNSALWCARSHCANVSRRVVKAYLRTVGTAGAVADPQTVSVLLERSDPSNVGETVFITAITLLSITLYHIVGDLTLENNKKNRLL